MVIENLPFLLCDTVGFIRKLPHQLVESFKSTLDEVREADLLLHIVDISHPNFEEQMNVVKQTLAEIGAGDKPVYTVFNKIDNFSYVQKDEDDSEKDDRIFFKRGGVLVQTSRRFLKTRWCFECTSNSLSK